MPTKEEQAAQAAHDAAHAEADKLPKPKPVVAKRDPNICPYCHTDWSVSSCVHQPTEEPSE